MRMGSPTMTSDSHSQWWGLYSRGLPIPRGLYNGGLAGTKRKAGGSADSLGFGDWTRLGGEGKK